MSVAKVSASRGASWIGAAMKLVTDRPAVWIGGTAGLIGLGFVFNLIPLIGGILNQILQFLFLILAFSYARAQMQGVEFDLDAALARTRRRLLPLFLMMLLSTLLFILCALPVMGALVAAGGIEFLMQKQSSVPELSLTSTLVVAFGGLTSGVAAALAFAATSFTMPLILFQEQSIGNALRLSLKAFRYNLAPLLVFGLAISLLLFVCALPFGLGLVFGVPTALASLYVIYEELLGKAESL
jgi:uncharacterized membrane protein